ncbi:Pyruvate/Phosphoenolpyruvate kinase-like domain-containing protein [Mycena metata]|uniref:3-methyl-2-oxobutanoate hydroxymethyltransferase n=1 Tax=Mycena metata TaxID=1033252 RepID=A0AAD7E020_9AGAR|nr:Pyruvate/Phosphoenolpyruvate kinase-like domain-containing protein [Mycena metata]
MVSKVKGRDKVTIQTLQKLREAKVPISMLTAYDYPTAVSCSSNSSIDITLVGDSLAQVCLGYKSTTQLTLDQMIHHASASQIEAVKLEGGEEIADLVRRLTSIGILHVSLSGYKVQGKNVASAKALVRAAKVLEEAGAFSAVVEAVPKELGRYITENVLVWDDAMGTWLGHKAKFVRRFGNLQTAREMGVQGYANAVKDGSFPDPQRESYTMNEAEWTRFLEEMDRA